MTRFSVPALAVLAGVSLLLAPAASGAVLYVDAADPSCVTGSGQPDPYAVVYCAIQDAIDDAADGDSIQIAAGQYTTPLDVEGFTGLDLVGAGVSQVEIRPSATLAWDVGGYGSSRQAALRVVSSTDVDVSGIAFDFQDVAANSVFGVLYWDSTGVLDDNEWRNMSVDDASGGYYEFVAYLRAPGYTPASPAEVTVSNSLFVDSGRVGVMTHQFVHAVIQGNEFTKLTDDFGYAMEIGSESTAEIWGNEIHGFDTPALSDGSASAGIYVENSFTAASPSMIKPVLIWGNELHGNQYGLTIGNQVDGYAGDVDIQIDFQDNHLHDNLDGGLYACDEDRENGSSVTFTSAGNTVTNNGEFGYLFYTLGDGELHVDVSEDTLTGHEYGMAVADYPTGPSTSLFDVTAHHCRIAGNTVQGLEVDAAILSSVTAQNNWWGCNAGPGQPGCDGVLGDAPFDPWLILQADADPTAIGWHETSLITADLTYNSDLVNTAAQGHLTDGTMVDYATNLGLIDAQAPTTGGIAQAVFDPDGAWGTAGIDVALDGELVPLMVVVGAPEVPALGPAGLLLLVVLVGLGLRGGRRRR